jgi:hypothetical protein
MHIISLVVPVLINLAPHNEDICWNGGIAPPVLTSALVGGEWSASRPSHINPGERAPCTHWIKGCMGTTAGLNAVAKRKISCPCHKLNPGHPAHSLLLYQLSYPGSCPSTYIQSVPCNSKKFHNKDSMPKSNKKKTSYKHEGSIFGPMFI